MQLKGLCARVAEWAGPVCAACGVTLWDVEYVKEGSDWHLRVFIDHPDGVTIGQCEAVTREMNDILDREDPVSQSYIFEVSSAGLERTLRDVDQFRQFIGSKATVRLFRARNGVKEFTAVILSVADEPPTIVFEGPEESLAIPLGDISRAHLYFEF